MTIQHDGRELTSTFLPDVIKEQGWTKKQTLLQLARKAGIKLAFAALKEKAKIVRYKGTKSTYLYEDYDSQFLR